LVNTINKLKKKYRRKARKKYLNDKKVNAEKSFEFLMEKSPGTLFF